MENDITDPDAQVIEIPKSKRLNAVYVMHSINGLAGSIVGIFIPIYFLNLNYPLTQVLIYWLIYGICVLFSFIGVSYYAKRFGLRKSILTGFPFLFLFIAMLYGLKSFSIPLYLLAIVSATSVGFYWFPLHLFFANNSSEEKMGTNVGRLFAYPQLVAILGPLIGGFIAALGGFSLLIVVSAIVYIISAIPLLWLPELEFPVNLQFSKFKNLFVKYPRYFLTEFVENIREEMEGIIWPIIVFMVFKDVFSIGVVGAFLGFGSFLFMLLIGNFADRLDKKSFIKIGAIIMIAIWVSRYFFQGPIPYYLLTLAAGFFGALIVIPFSTFYYNLSRKENIAEFIIFREIPITLGRIVIYSLAFLLIGNIKITFLITAFTSVFFLFF